MQILIFEFILVLFLLCVTVTIILDVDLFACTVLSSVFSFGAVMTYLMFGSPDVAFTEAVIGTMSTVFFAVALKKIDRTCKVHVKPIKALKELRKTGSSTAKEERIQKRRAQTRIVNIVSFIAIMGMCAAFCYGSKYLPAIGDPNSVPNTHVADYYIEHSKEDTAANNIVSGTLADYRGFDTMFETSVMFVSGLVVTIILTDKRHKTSKIFKKANPKASADSQSKEVAKS